MGENTFSVTGYCDLGTDICAITGDNQIALVSIGQYGGGVAQLALVGKISGAATPEPATAPLSLLALAGLASRRRRK